MTFHEELLTNLLQCGTADISLLEDCNCDFGKVLDELKENGFDLNLNNMLYIIFRQGLDILKEDIDLRIDELKAYDAITDQEKEELEKIQQLNACFGEDFSSYHNCLDTHFNYTNDNREIYEKYFKESLDKVMDFTGFDID